MALNKGKSFSSQTFQVGMMWTELRQYCEELWSNIHPEHCVATKTLVRGYCCQTKFNQLLNSEGSLIFLPELAMGNGGTQ